MFRFLHAADIHLDSPLQGLERYPDAPVEAVRAAPRRAFEALVDLAIEEGVAFVLLAGDLYDGDWKDYNTGLFFVAQMRRLAEASIPVFLVSGNHDAASQITKRLTLPPNVRHFASRRPETVELPALDVAIHGQSFASRRVTDDLAAGFPQTDAARFEIGLLHTSLDGRPGHARYAPCSVEGLRAKGYAYWALGHVHQREIVGRDPWIVFPGNLQGRHAREIGGKGATLVRVEHGRVVDVAHRDLDVVRWCRLELDLGRIDRADEMLELARSALGEAVESAEGRLVAARIVLQGSTRAHAGLVREPERWLHELRALAADWGEPGVWLEQIEQATRPPEALGGRRAREDALGGLLQRIERLDAGELALAHVAAELAELKRRLPAPLLGGVDDATDPGASPDDGVRADRFDPTDEAWLRARLPAVRAMLWSKLLDGEGAM
ncbi:MAG: DNA repair exonuclease [Myxococcota bacterium]